MGIFSLVVTIMS